MVRNRGSGHTKGPKISWSGVTMLGAKLISFSPLQEKTPFFLVSLLDKVISQAFVHFVEHEFFEHTGNGILNL